MSLILPPNYSGESGKIVRYWTDKKGEHTEIVANGTFEVIATVQYKDNPGDLRLLVRFMSTDATSYEDVLIPVKQIAGNGKKLLDFVPDWFVLLVTSPTKRLAVLQNILNFQRVEITKVIKVQRADQGYHIADDGTLLYVLGDVIINPPPDTNIAAISPFHLKKTSGTPGQGVVWVRHFCEQGPPQAALFVAALTAHIRPLLEATNNRGRFAVYVLGESGTGKSETAKLLCSLFKETSGVTLSSDKADIFRLMAACRDQPFLVDDLNESHIASATNKKRERLSEIIQQLSGSGILSILGEKFDVSFTTPIITAESLLTSPSSINRTLVVAFDKAFNADDMSWLQEHHGFYIDFLKNFIAWVCCNHSRLETAVQSWSFANLSGGENPDAFVGFHRLMRTHKILRIALELFLLHLREVYAVPLEDEKSWRQFLEEGINQAVFSDTLNNLRKGSSIQDRYYVDAVLDIFEGEEQRYTAKERLVAESYKHFTELNKRASYDTRIPRKIFFKSADEEYYCYRGDDLVEYLTAQRDNQYRISKKAVSAQLDHHGLLQRQAGELSYPIVEGCKQRYYHLRRNVVEQLLAERLEKYLWLGFDGDGNDNNDRQ